MQGCCWTPRYNEKAADLIYFAQADGDIKESFPEYFDTERGLIYYKPDLTGTKEDYVLTDPAKSN